MNITALPARSHWALQAAVAAAAAFAGTFMFLAALVLALLGPENLHRPVGWGIAGPPQASALMWPGVVISAAVATGVLAAMAIDAVIAPRSERQDHRPPAAGDAYHHTHPSVFTSDS
ncbi:hypothetical protein [Mycobacterium hubeiense]|uniref:hypothetical protein n=1 Tax=Mycobacterium hubeiense TaxID=1867256 RepID=UPI000C7F0175|nr:hypothetical protein [Mycobacterium sp. QGD 101]